MVCWSRRRDVSFYADWKSAATPPHHRSCSNPRGAAVPPPLSLPLNKKAIDCSAAVLFRVPPIDSTCYGDHCRTNPKIMPIMPPLCRGPLKPLKRRHRLLVPEPLYFAAGAHYKHTAAA
eukprot:Filipodium_phascolosomae@DN2695_c0_g1_i2.p1